MIPHAEHTLLRPRWPRRQEDRIEEEADQADAGEVALAEGPEALLQLAAEPGGGRLRHLAEPGLLAQRLDVAHRQATHEGADHQRLERLAGEEALAPAEELARERRTGVAHLRHLDHDLAVARLQPARPVAVVLAGRRLRSPLIAGTAKPLIQLLLDRTLQHQPRSQPSQFADNVERVHVDAFPREQRADLLSISTDGSRVRLTA